MKESEEEENSQRYSKDFPKYMESERDSKQAPLTTSVAMDLDVDGSWTFDQIFSSSYSSMIPTSPFLFSNRPPSPLWAFSDDNDVVFASSTSVDVFIGSPPPLHLLRFCPH